jgi:hypothetical protein
MCPAELDAVVRQGPHASDELPRLLKVLGIDEATLSRTQPVLQRDMVRVCASCQKKTLCNHDLDSGTLAQRYDEYCPTRRQSTNWVSGPDAFVGVGPRQPVDAD